MWISLEGECYNQLADRGGGVVSKIFYRSLGPHHWSKNKGDGPPQATEL